MSGPNPTPNPATAAQIPMAFAPSSLGKTSVSMESVEGMMSAPPIPIRARATISCALESAYAAYSLESPKITRPSWSARFRPNQSPSRPMVRSRPAKTRM